MKKDGRLDEIVKLCEKSGFVSIQQLAKQLNVSEITIRRDIDLLETLKLVRKEKGGATVIEQKFATPLVEYNIENSSVYRAEEKSRIGKAALSLIKPGDTMIIDSGSTLTQMVSQIPEGFPITGICCGFQIAQILDQKNISKLIMVGGIYHKQLDMFENVADEGNIFKNIRAEKAFISAFGINEQTGLTSGSFLASSIRRDIIDSVKHVILLADSSKFGRIECAHFAEINELDIIITDTGIGQKQIDYFKNQDIEVITV